MVTLVFFIIIYFFQSGQPCATPSVRNPDKYQKYSRWVYIKRKKEIKQTKLEYK